MESRPSMGKFPVILIVEDESLIRETVVQALRDAGWEVLQAVSGEGAVAQLGRVAQVIDVVFTDIQLGGSLSGWDVAEVARKSRPGVSVIYTSGNSINRRRQ